MKHISRSAISCERADEQDEHQQEGTVVASSKRPAMQAFCADKHYSKPQNFILNSKSFRTHLSFTSVNKSLKVLKCTEGCRFLNLNISFRIFRMQLQ